MSDWIKAGAVELERRGLVIIMRLPIGWNQKVRGMRNIYSAKEQKQHIWNTDRETMPNI